MAEVTQLVLSVDSRQVRAATGDLDKLGKAGQRTERSASSLTTTYQKLGRVAGTVVGSLVTRAIIGAADDYNQLNARLRLATESSQEFARAQAELVAISQRTRTGLRGTFDLYTQLANSTRELNVPQTDLLKVTEAIGQAIAVSGASADSARAALVQLGQGFASGALRGEELNSVLEQTPRLAQAIADGLGVTRGQLRELGKDGKLTAEAVFNAILKSTGKLDEEFRRLPPTVGQSLSQVGDSLLLVIGQIDQATGASQALAGVFQTIAKGISATARLFSGNELARVGAELELLEQRRRQFANFVPDFALARLDTLIERARTRLAELQRQAAIGTPLPGDQSGAEARRLGLTGPTPVPEAPRARSSGGGGRSAVDLARQYLDNLREQVRLSRDLSNAERVLEDIQLGRLGRVTPAVREQLLAAAQQLDQIRALEAAQRKADQEAAQAAAERLRVQEEGRQVYEATRTPLEQLAAETERLNKLLQAGAIDWDTYSRAIFAAQDEFDAIQKKAEETGEGLDNFATVAAERIQGALGDELTNILEGDFENIGDAFTRVINRMVAEAAAADLAKFIGLGNAAGGGGGGGLFSLIGTAFGALFGGGLADGGKASAGRLYEVNERGPELLNVAGRQFLMMGNQSGTVTPNGSGGQTMNNTFNFSVQGPVDRRTEAQIAKAATRGLQRGQRWL